MHINITCSNFSTAPGIRRNEIIIKAEGAYFPDGIDDADILETVSDEVIAERLRSLGWSVYPPMTNELAAAEAKADFLSEYHAKRMGGWE